MSDVISRADAINAFWEDSDIRTAEVRATLKALPSAELPKGELISRADAIEAVRSFFKDLLGKSKCDYDDELQVYVINKEEKTLLTYNKRINDKLRSLPSAELTLQTPQTYGKSINPSNAEVVADYINRADAIEAVAQQWLFEASVGNPYVNDDDIGEYRKLAEELFEDVPSADAVPQLRQTDTLIIADALRYLAKDTERHLVDRTRADALRQQFLKYGASMCKGGAE